MITVDEILNSIVLAQMEYYVLQSSKNICRCSESLPQHSKNVYETF